jgi:DNA (cytosine-5)-methyltransferase 1
MGGNLASSLFWKPFMDLQRSNLQENRWKNFPTKSPICGGDDGLPRELDNITFSKWRNESIKAGGNAVVPKLIYVLFKTIEAYEATTKT